MTTDEDEEMRIIFDNQNGYMTSISTKENGEQEGFKMRQRTFKIDESQFEGNMDEESTEYTITKTGNTRTIDGYLCEEYEVIHQDGTANMWVTEELDVEYEDMFRAMTSQMQQQKNTAFTNTNVYGVEGFPIQITNVSSNGKDTSVMYFYDIKSGDDLDLSIFDTDGVNITELGF